MTSTTTTTTPLSTSERIALVLMGSRPSGARAHAGPNVPATTVDETPLVKHTLAKRLAERGLAKRIGTGYLEQRYVLTVAGRHVVLERYPHTITLTLSHDALDVLRSNEWRPLLVQRHDDEHVVAAFSFPIEATTAWDMSEAAEHCMRLADADVDLAVHVDSTLEGLDWYDPRIVTPHDLHALLDVVLHVLGHVDDRHCYPCHCEREYADSEPAGIHPADR